MKETGNTSSQEAPQENLENIKIIHLDKYDVMANRSSDPELVRGTLQNLRTEPDKVIKQPDGSEIFVKKRRFASPSTVHKMANTPDNEWRYTFSTDRQTEYAFNSLMNEFTVARKLKKIIDSSDIKEIAKKIRVS